MAFSLDCCDRELMRYVATTGGITGEMVQDLLLESLEYRFGQSERVPHPLEWLTDNGSCYIAKETRSFASSLGFVVCTTPVRSPQSNGMAEAFVKTFKRDYVYLNDLPDAATVMTRLPEWIEDYNRSHPHKGLKMKSPGSTGRNWHQTNEVVSGLAGATTQVNMRYSSLTGTPASASFRIGMICSSVNRFFMFIFLFCDEHY